MNQIKLKRVYELAEESDGFRVLVDRLWPRGIKKENLLYDLWEKDITPSNQLRSWFHVDPTNRWQEFRGLYTQELEHSKSMGNFIQEIQKHPVVTFLFASKNTTHTHAMVLKDFVEHRMA